MIDESSILDTIKKQLLLVNQDAFDEDVILLINAAFATLNQLGYGPDKTFAITSKDEKWIDFTTDDMLATAQSYIYISVRMVFDPPDRSNILEALKELKKEQESRLNIQGEGYRT